MKFEAYAKKTPVVVRMNPYFTKCLDAYAKKCNVTRSQLINVILAVSLPEDTIPYTAVCPRNHFSDPLKFVMPILEQLRFGL